MITFYQKTVTTRRLKKIDEFKVGAWVHVEEPNEGELDRLTADLQLDRGLLSDAIDPYEVPRVETDAETTYFFTRIPYEEGGRIQTAPVLFGIAPNFVFSVSHRALPFFDSFIDGRIELHTTQKIRFILKMLAEVDTAYYRYITIINKEVRKMQAKLHHTISNRDIIRFVHLETVLSDMNDALVPTNTALSNIISGKFLSLFEEDKEYAEDVFLANNQLVELCRINLRAIMNIRNAYSTIMTNNLNRVIKLLTGLTIVLTIPTITVNLYGMNVPLPFQDSPHAFWIIMGIATVLTGLALWLFSRKHWL